MIEIDFRNFTKEEVIEKLRELEDPKLVPLIKWIQMAIAFDNVSYDIRCLLADAELAWSTNPCR